MKVRICDMCKRVIENPYEAKMTEFYIGVDYDEYGEYPVKCKTKTKVDLCESCYQQIINASNGVKNNV